MSSESTIVDAIEHRRILDLRYHGTSRLVEPHIFGYDAKGHLALSAYQLSGTGGGWRMFHVAEIERLDETRRRFSRSRPDYNPDDPAFGGVVARLGRR
jgi:hypothetical protein